MRTELPPARLGVLPQEIRDAVLSAITNAEDPIGIAWREKLRRFASLYGRRLRGEASRRFGKHAPSMLAWMCRALLQASCVSAFKGRGPSDPAFLSAAAYCLDALPTGDSRRAGLEVGLSDGITEYREWLLNEAPQPPAMESLGPNFDFVRGRWRAEASFAKGIVIIAPTPFSLFTINVFELCQRLGVPVQAVIIKKFTLARLREEWRRDGAMVLKKIWRKIILRSNENADRTAVSLSSVRASLGIHYSDVRRRAASLGVPVMAVDTFGELPRGLIALSPRLAIFTGGGMVSKKLLAGFADGIINIHSGHLPHYKGMDVVHAPVLEGRLDAVGITAHFMSARLDGGPVLERCTIKSSAYPSTGAIQNALGALMPLLAIDAMLGYFSGRLPPITQPQSGRQYFLVHRRLTRVLEERLKLTAAGEDTKLLEIAFRFASEFGQSRILKSKQADAAGDSPNVPEM